MKLGIAVDSRVCMACYCCFMACKDEHCGYDSKLSKAQPMMGQKWIDVHEWERGTSSRRVKTASVASLCAHCEKPACMNVAKDGAVYKRPDGIVIVDPEKSKGQKAIADSCPMMHWNEELEIPQKCTMCAELLDDPEYVKYLGDPSLKKPRCVEACPNKALYFGDMDDPNSEISKFMASGARETPPHESLIGDDTNVKWFNVPTVYLAGTVMQPKELDEVLVGAKVKLSCKETGETWETETNYFGDWEVEWLPKNKSIDVVIEAAGYKAATYTAQTDIDRYVDMTYMAKA